MNKSLTNNNRFSWNIAVDLIVSITSIIIVCAIPQINIPSTARWILIACGAVALIWFGLPWLCFGLMYLVLNRIGKAERWMGSQLLSKFPESHYLKMMFDSTYRGETVYAATALVMWRDKPDDFLWIKNRTFNRWMPPGGRLLVNELPHEAVKLRVCAETGIPIENLEFSTIFNPIHSTHITADEANVEAVPIPFIVQRENLRQRGGFPYHYDFIYVLMTDWTGPLQGSRNPNKMTIARLKRERLPEQPFPNIILLAEQVLSKINSNQQ